MLRLAIESSHKTGKVSPLVASEWMPNSARRYQFVQQALRDSRTPVIIADNVAVYYAESPKQDWAVTGENFACVAPPFERLFIDGLIPAT